MRRFLLNPLILRNVTCRPHGTAYDTNHSPAESINKLCKGFGSPLSLGIRVSKAPNQEQKIHAALKEAKTQQIKKATAILRMNSRGQSK